MNNPIKNKLMIITLALILTVSFISVKQTVAYDQTQTWTSQATGCNPVQGNIDQHAGNIYLGSGTTVPQAVLNYDSLANASILEDWKSNMIGMYLNQFKSFIIPAAQGYTSGNLTGKDLFFEVRILAIVLGNSPTTSNSIVDIQYSIYTNCKVASTIPSQTGTSSSSSMTNGTAGTNNNGPLSSFNIFVIAGLVGVVIILAVGYFIYNGHRRNLETEKILNETRKKETKLIKALKDSLDPQNAPKSSAPTKKVPPSRRRR